MWLFSLFSLGENSVKNVRKTFYMGWFSYYYAFFLTKVILVYFPVDEFLQRRQFYKKNAKIIPKQKVLYLPTNLHFLSSSKCVQNISPLSLGISFTNSGCVSSHSCLPEMLKLLTLTAWSLNSFIAHSIQCLTCNSDHWTGSIIKIIIYHYNMQLLYCMIIKHPWLCESLLWTDKLFILIIVLSLFKMVKTIDCKVKPNGP